MPANWAFFTPKKKIHFVIKTDNRFVGTDGYVESNEPTIFSQEESATISILCEDPILYDETEHSIDRRDFDFNAVAAEFEFPFSNESLVEPLIELGNISHKPKNVIDYIGEYDIGFTISLHCKGMVKNPTIYSARQSGEFRMITDNLSGIIPDSHEFLKGDDITICTIPGKKSILLLRNGEVYNILHVLKAGSVWPILKNGKNEFVIDAESGFECISIRYEYSLGYLGV